MVVARRDFLEGLIAEEYMAQWRLFLASRKGNGNGSAVDGTLNGINHDQNLGASDVYVSRVLEFIRPVSRNPSVREPPAKVLVPDTISSGSFGALAIAKTLETVPVRVARGAGSTTPPLALASPGKQVHYMMEQQIAQKLRELGSDSARANSEQHVIYPASGSAGGRFTTSTAAEKPTDFKVSNSISMSMTLPLEHSTVLIRFT